MARESSFQPCNALDKQQTGTNINIISIGDESYTSSISTSVRNYKYVLSRIVVVHIADIAIFLDTKYDRASPGMFIITDQARMDGDIMPLEKDHISW